MSFESAGVVATHLTESLRRAAPELLTLEIAHRLLGHCQQPRVLAALQRRGVGEVELWKIFRELLEEGVSIRDLTTLLQGLLLNEDESIPARWPTSSPSKGGCAGWF